MYYILYGGNVIFLSVIFDYDIALYCIMPLMKIDENIACARARAQANFIALVLRLGYIDRASYFTSSSPLFPE